MDILVINEDGIKVGTMSLERAKQMAIAAKKSLVLVDPKANVYKIIDQGKLKYEQKQKERDQRAQKRTHKVKEIKFGLTTEQHDIDTKVRKIREFLADGMKTKVTIQLHGREAFCKDYGLEKIKKIVELVVADNIATIDKGPLVEEKSIVVFLNPAKIQQ